MALSALELYRIARNEYGFTGTLDDVRAVLDTIDRTPYEAAERARYEAKVWDETAPLVGHDAEWWRNHLGHRWPEGGKIFLIYIDGGLSIVQPNDPDSGGWVPMDYETALARAQETVDRLVKDAVDEKVKEQVLTALLSQSQ